MFETNVDMHSSYIKVFLGNDRIELGNGSTIDISIKKLALLKERALIYTVLRLKYLLNCFYFFTNFCSEI